MSILNHSHFSQLVQNLKLFCFSMNQHGSFHIKKIIFDYLLNHTVKTYQSIYRIQSFYQTYFKFNKGFVNMRTINGKTFMIPIYGHFRFINLKHYINRKLSLGILKNKDISKQIRIIVMGVIAPDHMMLINMKQKWGVKYNQINTLHCVIVR